MCRIPKDMLAITPLREKEKKKYHRCQTIEYSNACHPVGTVRLGRNGYWNVGSQRQSSHPTLHMEFRQESFKAPRKQLIEHAHLRAPNLIHRLRFPIEFA